MARFCPHLSKAPKAWQKGAKGRWTCLGCGRRGLRVRHRHRRWPPGVKIPVYGERRGSRNEIVCWMIVSPIDAWLKAYKWRLNMASGYVYRPSRVGGRQPGSKAINLYVQREILGLKPGDPREGHHDDDDPLNNQRWNLEIVTRSENEKYKYGRNIRDSRLPVEPPTPAPAPSTPKERAKVLAIIQDAKTYANEADILATAGLPEDATKRALRDLLLQNKVYNHAGKGTYRAL